MITKSVLVRLNWDGEERNIDKSGSILGFYTLEEN